MKKSNLILLVLLAAILATLLASAVTLRVKMDKQAFVKMVPPSDSFTDVPLGAFSVVAVDGLNVATITAGPANTIHLPQRESERPSYRLSLDTLYVTATDKDRGNIRVNARALRSVLFKGTEDGTVAGFSGDSLSVYGLNSTSILVAGSTLGRLYLQADTCANVNLKDMDCKEFLPRLAGVELAVDSSTVHSIRGRWDGTSSLKLDGYSLNHVEKIDHEQ